LRELRKEILELSEMDGSKQEGGSDKLLSYLEEVRDEMNEMHEMVNQAQSGGDDKSIMGHMKDLRDNLRDLHKSNQVYKTSIKRSKNKVYFIKK
jgi:uncharacterized coiled-coil DUF342 family protein